MQSTPLSACARVAHAPAYRFMTCTLARAKRPSEIPPLSDGGAADAPGTDSDVSTSTSSSEFDTRGCQKGTRICAEHGRVSAAGEVLRDSAAQHLLQLFWRPLPVRGLLREAVTCHTPKSSLFLI